MKNIKLYIIFIISLVTISTDAQLEHNLFGMDFVPQSQWINPSSKPKTKFHFGLGAMMNSSWPLSYNDIVEKNVNDTIYVNANQLLSSLNKNNQFQLGFSPDISFGFAIGPKAYFQGGIRENIIMNASAPRDFFQFMIEGNGQASTLGQFQNVGDFRLNATHYRELFVGGSYQINPKWSLGLRLKYLVGFENIKTVKSEIAVKTDPIDYRLSLKGEYQVNSSGLDSNFMDKYKGNPFIFSSNTGFGMDAGATYKFNDKITFSGSLVDLGFINWTEGNKVLKNRNMNATYEFSGIDAYNVISNNQSNYIQNILDSIKTTFDFEEVKTTESYSSSLYTKIYVGGDYQILKQLNVGALTAFSLVNSELLPSLSIYARANLIKIVQAQLNYQINHNSLTNLGLGFAVNLGPIQYYFTSDNLIGSAFNPLGSKTISLRTGLNIQWSYGKEKSALFDVKKPKYVEIQGENPKKLETEPVKDISKNNDMDGDLVFDEVDICPEIPGSPDKEGCPEKTDISKIISGELLIFEKNSAKLTPLANALIDKQIANFKLDETVKLYFQIRVNAAENALNPNLGLERTKYIMEILKMSGVNLSRFIVITKNIDLPFITGNEQFDLLLNRSAEVKQIKK